MNSQNPPLLPPEAPSTLAATTSSPKKVALWRWWIATILIGGSPLLGSLVGGTTRGDGPIVIPRSVPGLLFFCALQLLPFAVIWGIAWPFARPDRDALMLRLRERWAAVIGWGALYSIGMRVGLAMLMVVVLMVLALLGFDVEKLSKLAAENGQGAQKAFAPVMENATPLYKFLMITLVSFVVAGLREELWRTFTLAGLQRIFPQGWSQNVRDGVSLAVSSVLFGLGHIYQGVTGVVLTSVLGVALGAIILKHRSIWPAVVAHGCFNAVSFIGLAMLKK